MRCQRPRRKEIVDEALSCPETNAAVPRGELVSTFFSGRIERRAKDRGRKEEKKGQPSPPLCRVILYLFAPVIRTNSCSSGATVSHGATADPAAADGRGASIVIVAYVCVSQAQEGSEKLTKEKKSSAPIRIAKKLGGVTAALFCDKKLEERSGGFLYAPEPQNAKSEASA